MKQRILDKLREWLWTLLQDRIEYEVEMLVMNERQYQIRLEDKQRRYAAMEQQLAYLQQQHVEALNLQVGGGKLSGLGGEGFKP